MCPCRLNDGELFGDSENFSWMGAAVWLEFAMWLFRFFCFLVSTGLRASTTPQLAMVSNADFLHPLDSIDTIVTAKYSLYFKPTEFPH